MTLSIEDWPAQCGPMMGRISCSRTSNETPWSATTPPNASETSSISRMAAPTFLPAFMSLREAGPVSRRLPRRGNTVGLCLHASQVRRPRTRAALLVAHLRLDDAARLVRLEGIGLPGVFLGGVSA